MKLRIIKKSGRYYCQYKSCFWWITYRDTNFKTLKQAENWLEHKITTFPDIYFEIIKEYKLKLAAKDTGMP
jgi:hypothetical protein